MSLLLFPGVDDLGPFQKQATLIKAYRRKVVAIVRIYSGMSEPWAWGAISPPHFDQALVTQPMMQCRPNPTELRSIDSYNQILCRFQKNKQKVYPLSPLSNGKTPFTPPKDEKKFPLGG